MYLQCGLFLSRVMSPFFFTKISLPLTERKKERAELSNPSCDDDGERLDGFSLSLWCGEHRNWITTMSTRGLHEYRKTSQKERERRAKNIRSNHRATSSHEKQNKLTRDIARPNCHESCGTHMFFSVLYSSFESWTIYLSVSSNFSTGESCTHAHRRGDVYISLFSLVWSCSSAIIW